MERIGEIIRRQRFILEQGCHMRDSLIIVLEGEFRCTIGGSSYTAERNAVCVFPKGVVFDRQVMVPLRCVYLQFDEFPWNLTAGMLPMPDAVRAESTIGYLTQAVEAKDEARTDHYLRDLFFITQPVEYTPDIPDPAVRSCIRFLEEHLAQPITLQTLASREAMSGQNLIRKFKRHTGLTPMQYLAAARLNESKILLRDTSLSVSRIAEICGFENVYYFSNFFRKAAGISPSGYRRAAGL